MFSSFSSFLPSVLQSNQDQRSHQSHSSLNKEISQPVNTTPPVPQPADCTTADSKSKKKGKREKLVNETFIVVRPPPSKSNHPLNLQVQLVPPQSRHDRPYATVNALQSSNTDLSASASSTDLRRTNSGQSESSTFSGYNSASSISSFASSSASSSGRRMIIPLYNLQAHNVISNVIVDAGTDAKVAKFAKRGLEIIGLAILEPIEVWGNIASPGALPHSSSARTSVDDPQRELGLFPRQSTYSSSSRPVTPDFPVAPLSPSTYNDIHRKPTVILTPATPDESLSNNAQSQRKGPKMIFSKMFKKKDTSSKPISIVIPTPAVDMQGLPIVSRPCSRQSQNVSPSSPQLIDLPRLDDNIPLSGISSTVTLCPPILGIQPSLYPPVSPPKGRPTKYVWVVRKWLKGTDLGLLNGMMGRLSANGRGDLVGASVLQVDVRFEWSRGRKKEKERGRKSRTNRRSPAQVLESESVSGRGSAVKTPEPPSSRSVQKSPSRSRDSPSGIDSPSTSYRQSRLSHHSASSDASTSVASSAHRVNDSDDDSDPEDSETPWTCTLIMQPTRHSPTMHRPADQRDHVVRLKIATLLPTPHHPKVVGLLKVPFPLPDIEVERLAVHRRVVTAQGVNRTVSNSSELVLTAEEIKDSISSTALWLVVRESFGGVGRERRKGDGWRIRA